MLLFGWLQTFFISFISFIYFLFLGPFSPYCVYGATCNPAWIWAFSHTSRCLALLDCSQNLPTIHLINWFNLPYPTFQFIQEKLCAFTPLIQGRLESGICRFIIVSPLNMKYRPIKKNPPHSNPTLILHLSVNDLTGSTSHRLCINCRKKGELSVL